MQKIIIILFLCTGIATVSFAQNNGSDTVNKRYLGFPNTSYNESINTLDLKQGYSNVLTIQRLQAGATDSTKKVKQKKKFVPWEELTNIDEKRRRAKKLRDAGIGMFATSFVLPILFIPSIPMWVIGDRRYRETFK